MKNGILVCYGDGPTKNIGDYVQSLAAAQFAGPAPELVERERLADYSGEPVRVVLNGWFMFNPRQFPPSEWIRPLLVSFHVRPKIERRFFTPETTAYLKAREPIGCRSQDMVEMLSRHGICGEFSSCLTLTLGETYRHRDAGGKPVFVDPYFDRPSRKRGRLSCALWLVRGLAAALRRPIQVACLSRKFAVFVGWPCIRLTVVRWAYVGEFLRTYSTLFAADLLLGADYASHSVSKTDNGSHAALLSAADRLLRRYEVAPFVVTSRLHCTLPCIGMGTPVWTVVNPRMKTGRFGGNERFMNLIDFVDRRLLPRKRPESEDGLIHAGDRPPTGDAFRPHAEALAAKCRAFYCCDAAGGL